MKPETKTSRLGLRTTLYGLLVAAMVLSFGCRSTGRRHEPGEETPIPRDRLRMYLNSAQDPRRYWLSVYRSDEGPVFVGGNRMHPNQLFDQPFHTSKDSDIPIIEVRTRSTDDIDALIDTSSRENWVDFETAAHNGLIPLGPPPYTRKPRHVVDPDNTGYLALSSKIRIKQMHVENALFYLRTPYMDLGPLTRNQFHPMPHMVLGAELLKAFRFVQLDYAGHQAIFSSTLPYNPPPTRLLAEVPLLDLHGIIACRGIIDGEPVTLIVDTAGDYELALPVKPDDGTVRQLSVGDLVFRQVACVSTERRKLGLPQYPRIGARLLSRFQVTFDFRKKVIIFERPAL